MKREMVVFSGETKYVGEHTLRATMESQEQKKINSSLHNIIYYIYF